MDEAIKIHKKMPTYAIKHTDNKITLIAYDEMQAKINNGTVKIK